MENRHNANIVRLGPRIPIQVEEPQVVGRMDAIMNLAIPDRVLVARQTDTSTSSSETATSSCGPNACEKPTSSSSFTMPIILGVAIPVIGAAILFIILQRRHVRKQREEDANDRHASMDFGLGEVPQNRKSKRFQQMGTEMSMTEKRGTRAGMSNRQISMDMADMRMANPYLLPPELQDSRESIHSLSRTVQKEDPYRPVTQYFPGDGDLSRPRSKQGSSIYTGSSTAPSRMNDKADLLSNASNIAHTPVQEHAPPPPRKHSIPQSNSSLSPIDPVPAYSAPPYPVEPPQAHVPEAGSIQRKGLPPSPQPEPVPVPHDSEKMEEAASDSRSSSPFPDQGLAAEVPDDRQSYGSGDRSSNNYLAQLIMEREPSPPPPPRPRVDEREPALPNMRQPGNRNRGPPGPQNQRGDRRDRGDARDKGDRRDGSDRRGRADPRAKGRADPRDQGGRADPRERSGRTDQRDRGGRGDPRDRGNRGDPKDRGNRGRGDRGPTPNNDPPRGQPYYVDGSEDYTQPVEQYPQPGLRAPGYNTNRQSVGFRPLPPDATLEVDDPEIRANRIRSFYKEYFDESKPENKQPAPAPAPVDPYYEEEDDYNFLGDAAYFDPETNQFVMPGAQPVTRRAMTPPPAPRFQQGPRVRTGSFGAMSANGAMRDSRFASGPRAHSSASGRMPPRGRPGRPGPKRPIPPPAPLNTLPTPSKLRDDSFAIMNSTDFAPPSTFRDRQIGRAESPLGERRPYSPTVRAFTPTISAFDELAPMPSPHMLRKSGTFTSLDFAPPKKFRDPDSTSETGSIRSTGSGLSSAQLGAIRNGAYRVSRLPADMVGTKDDLTASLKPQWGMRAGA